MSGGQKDRGKCSVVRRAMFPLHRILCAKEKKNAIQTVISKSCKASFCNGVRLHQSTIGDLQKCEDHQHEGVYWDLEIHGMYNHMEHIIVSRLFQGFGTSLLLEHFWFRKV